MKKALVAIVALLAFSMLSTSVSAPVTDYYWVSFYGEASGSCIVQLVPGPPVRGKGSVQIRGSAIAKWNQTYQFYWTHRLPPGEYDPNTRLWTRRTYMTASWNNKKLTVWMWPACTFLGVFNTTANWYYVFNMTYFGYYMGDAGLQFISGRAAVISQGDPVSLLQVVLYVGGEAWLGFTWLGAEYNDYPVARSFMRGMTVWGPIPWHPSGP